jgi:hypothetical protein
MDSFHMRNFLSVKNENNNKLMNGDATLVTVK